MPILTDRQKTLEASIKELEKLNEQHSENLAAFGAIKREDERREEFLDAVDNGYTVFAIFAFFGAFYIGMMDGRLLDLKLKLRRIRVADLNRVAELPAKESGNSQTASIKKMKRQIPILYLTTLTCVIVHFSLIASFLAGQYYTGSCPIYGLPSVKREKTLGTGELSSFSDYHTFAGKLQSTLDSHLQELNKTMQSPNLDAREIGWKYESIAIEAVFQNHTNLKQHQVDRNATISGQIRYPLINFKVQMFLEMSVMVNVIFIGLWAIPEGSIWQPWHFAKYYFLETYCF
ncbi:hypothetical protein Ddc_10208 [Ditylenchus destructor]|nr:hypothetical protein Ddc_10208 [Ditylenchus destructor]